jgi:phosphoribosylformylglycinamidine synthase PurS subunit
MWQPGTEPPSFDKQIIRDWLETTGWNKLPPGPELPPEIVAQALERYAAVADRLLATGNKDEGMQQVDEGFWNLEVIVMPKAGVNDPQGDAVRSGLHSLGFDGTRNVRIGKRIRLEVAAGSEHEALALGREMCDRLLANPVIEEYTIRAIAEQVPV